MELNSFWAALLRRWYLTVGGVLIAVALTALIAIRIGPTYKAEGTVLLFPPTTTIKNGTTVETQGNPYLMLGGLSQARDIVTRTLQSKSAKDAFATKEPRASYEATPDFTTSGPVIVIDVSSHSSDAAVRGLGTVMDTVPGILTSMQSGLDLSSSAFITSRPLTADTKPEVVRSGQIRAGIVVGAVVVSLVLLLIALLDGLLAARPTRARARELSASAGDDPGESRRMLDDDSRRARHRGSHARSRTPHRLETTAEDQREPLTTARK